MCRFFNSSRTNYQISADKGSFILGLSVAAASAFISIFVLSFPPSVIVIVISVAIGVLTMDLSHPVIKTQYRNYLERNDRDDIEEFSENDCFRP